MGCPNGINGEDSEGAHFMRRCGNGLSGTVGPFCLMTSGGEFADGQKEDGDSKDQQVAVTDIGGGSLIALYGGVEFGPGVGSQLRLYLTLRGNDGGGSGVGGPQHRTACFKRTHLRNLQMLRQGDGVAEPGNVGDVQKDGGLVVSGFLFIADLADDFLTEDVFVADVGQDPLVFDGKGFLQRIATREVAQRNLHHADEPVKSCRDEFAEGDEVVFVVPVAV